MVERFDLECDQRSPAGWQHCWVARLHEDPVGRLRVLVDDVLKVDAVRRTLPSPNCTNLLKLGICNAFESTPTEPYDTGVAVFDALRREER